MLKTLIGLFVVFLITSCATSSKPSSSLNRLNVRMSKAEVIQTLGNPESTRADGAVEFFIYSLKERTVWPGENVPIVPSAVIEKYFVKFVDGKVQSYGRLGDFDSTKPFETKHEIDVKIEEE